SIVEPVAAPPWLLEMIEARSGASSSSFGDRTAGRAFPGENAPDRAGAKTRHLAKRADALLQVVERAPIGNRNSALFWAACRFGEMVGEGVIVEAVDMRPLPSCGCCEETSGRGGLTGTQALRFPQACRTPNLASFVIGRVASIPRAPGPSFFTPVYSHRQSHSASR